MKNRIEELDKEFRELSSKGLEVIAEWIKKPSKNLHEKLDPINAKMKANRDEYRIFIKEKELKDLLDSLPVFGMDYGILDLSKSERILNVPIPDLSKFPPPPKKTTLSEEMEKIKHFIKGKKVSSREEAKIGSSVYYTGCGVTFHEMGKALERQVEQTFKKVEPIKKEDILGEEILILKDIRDYVGNALSNLYALESAIKKLSKTESGPKLKKLDPTEFRKELQDLVDRFEGENLTVVPEYIYTVCRDKIETKYEIRFSTIKSKNRSYV